MGCTFFSVFDINVFFFFSFLFQAERVINISHPYISSYKHSPSYFMRTACVKFAEMFKIRNVNNIEININVLPSQEKTRDSRFLQNVPIHQPDYTVSA